MEGEAQPQLRELQEELSDLNALVEHRGYKRLMAIADAQIKANTDQVILKTLEKMDDVLAQEQTKGIVQGMRILTSLIPTEIERLESEIASLLEEQKNANSKHVDESSGS